MDSFYTPIQEKNFEIISNGLEKMRVYTAQESVLKKIVAVLDEFAIVSITDRKGDIIFVNKEFCRISKYSQNELIGQNHRILKSGHHSDAFFKGMWKTISGGHIWRGLVKNKAKDGSYYWVKSIIMPVLDDKGIPEQYISIRIDVTELENVKEELQEIDIKKERFITMVTHDLRSLLQPIEGYCKMLKEPKIMGALNYKQAEAVNEIIDCSKRLERMISDLHDVHKLDLKQLKFNYEIINLGLLLEAIKTAHSSLLKERQVELTIKIPNKKITLYSDGQRLFQIFSNLIRNSIDFVPEKKGKIEIGALVQSQYIIFYLSDNGEGIVAKNQETLFHEFYQVHEINKEKHTGSGLGLAICKGIVEGLGGKIWVESKEGEGVVFFFSIPTRRS